MTQFAMVEELAFLIKDNLTSKHLVLSVEEALVDFLQNDTSSDRTLELEPMSPYNRLLLHRLADIFGFAHESVGEGDDRHLILERCPESSMFASVPMNLFSFFAARRKVSSIYKLLIGISTGPLSLLIVRGTLFPAPKAYYILASAPVSASVMLRCILCLNSFALRAPSILVSDILWQYDEYQSPTTSHQLLRRQEALPDMKTNQASFHSSLEEREAAYLAARERIFSVDAGKIKESVTPKPRNVPVVARRMIAHALGQRIRSDSSSDLQHSKEYEGHTEEFSTKEKKEDHLNLNLKISQETTFMSGQKLSSDERIMHGSTEGRNASSSSASQSERRVQKKPANKRSTSGDVQQIETPVRVVTKDNLKQEHLGAAKRIFAHALGLQGSKDINALLLKFNEAKTTDKE